MVTWSQHSLEKVFSKCCLVVSALTTHRDSLHKIAHTSLPLAKQVCVCVCVVWVCGVWGCVVWECACIVCMVIHVRVCCVGVCCVCVVIHVRVLCRCVHVRVRVRVCMCKCICVCRCAYIIIDLGRGCGINCCILIHHRWITSHPHHTSHLTRFTHSYTGIVFLLQALLKRRQRCKKRWDVSS